MHIKKGWKVTFWIIGLYIIYFITGLILVETHTVSKWYFAPNAIITDRGGTHHGTAPAGVDGPHIFYQNNSIIVKSIIKTDTGYAAQTDSFYDRDSIIVHCQIEAHPEWNFSTSLHTQLATEASTYTEPDSLIAISDIEGEFGAFRKLLTANHVMDDEYNWTYGTGHLVLVGDFFDRGLNVTETLWLIYHLEQEAEKTGGKVHFILGNHELMNMQEDIRYISNKYLENSTLIGHEYKNWYKPNTELGKWLLTKNIIEQIGGIIFVHGGISDEVNEMGLSIQDINDMCRPTYYVTRENRDVAYNETTKTLMKGKASPFWHRGYANGDATQQQVNKTLMLYGANTIVIGHSVVDEVSTFYDSRIIDIDTKHSEGNSQGLFYAKGKYYHIDTSGKKKELK